MHKQDGLVKLAIVEISGLKKLRWGNVYLQTIPPFFFCAQLEPRGFLSLTRGTI